MSKATIEDCPTPWLEEGRTSQHFQPGTAAAYKRGEYEVIPNDELALLHLAVVNVLINTASDKAMERMNSMDEEIQRRIKAAGIELV